MKRSILVLLVLSCACSSPGNHREVRVSTDGASTSLTHPRVSIRLTVADMSRARADELFGTGEVSGSDVGPEFPQRIEELSRADAGVEIQHQSLLVLLDAQRGDISVGDRVSYVLDFEFDSDRGIADPVIGELWEGLWFEARPGIRSDGAGIDVDFHLELSTVERPIPESTVQLPSGPPVTVELPACTTLSESRRITVRPGRAFAFVLPRADTEERVDRRKVVAIAVDLPEGMEIRQARTEDGIEIAPR